MSSIRWQKRSFLKGTDKSMPVWHVFSGVWTGVIAALPADFFGYRATGAILGFVVIIVGIGVAAGPYLGGERETYKGGCR